MGVAGLGVAEPLLWPMGVATPKGKTKKKQNLEVLTLRGGSATPKGKTDLAIFFYFFIFFCSGGGRTTQWE
jgi:hypothetical protein